MSSERKPQVALANIQKQTWDFLNKIFAELKAYDLVSLENLNEFAENPPPDLNPILCIVDSQTAGLESTEWVQTLKMTYPCPLIVIHGPGFPIDFALMKKNGADKLIHFHFDQEFIADLIMDLAPVDFGKDIPLAALNSIDYQEVHPQMEVNFDVYVHLPGNQKTILLRKKGSLVEQRTLQKIQDQKQHLYFRKTETKQFLEYARTALTMNDSEEVSALTEKLLKAKRTIFEIMAEFFNTQVNNFETGKQIFERCRQIINDYQLLKPRDGAEALRQISIMSGQIRTFYHDSINVCNFSALLGHALELPVESIEALALAGLLHNIGQADVTGYNPQMNWQNLTEPTMSEFKKYPERSVFMVKSQRVPLSTEISEAIAQHMESVNGKGFPHKLQSQQISQFAKIIRLAVRIQEMTALTTLESKLTLQACLEKIKEEALSGDSPHDVSLVMTIFKKMKM